MLSVALESNESSQMRDALQAAWLASEPAKHEVMLAVAAARRCAAAKLKVRHLPFPLFRTLSVPHPCAWPPR